MVNQPAWDSTSEELVRSSKTVEFHLQPLIDELNNLTVNAPTQDKIKGIYKQFLIVDILSLLVYDKIQI